MSRRMSEQMLAVLRNAEAGRGLISHVSGLAAMGGASGTVYALRKRGLIGQDQRLTPAGVEALKTGRV